MERIKFNDLDFEFRDLSFSEMNNVDDSERSPEFEKQNAKYRLLGFKKENTTFYQSFDLTDDIYTFCRNLFNNYSASIIKQTPGNTIPAHTDTFYNFCKKNNSRPDDTIRVNIFLETWKTGHYFEIDNTPVLNWDKGDAIIIPYGVEHLSGNMGKEPKYTMQITGLKHEFTRSQASI